MSDFNEADYIEVKDLYQAIAGDRSWDARWSEYKDPSEENEKLRPYRASFPIVHRWKCVDIEEGEWKTYSIDINDKRLREVLERLFKNVPSLDLDTDILSFKTPFQPFLHKWNDFKKVLEEEENDRMRNLLQHVSDIVSPFVEPVLEKVKKARNAKAVDYKLLIDCCVPGEMVLGKWQKQPQAYRITSATERHDYLKLETEYYDWDGVRSGFRSFRFDVDEFRGETSLDDLDVIPFKLHPNIDEVKAELIERGKLFESMAGYSYRHYKGAMLTAGRSLYVSTRVVIDAYAYHKFNEQKWISARKGKGNFKDEEEKEIVIEGEDNSSHDGSVSEADIDDDEVNDEEEDEEDEEEEEGFNKYRVASKPFKEVHRLLSLPVVKGFDLENRRWAEFYLTGFSNITWNEAAYDKLVLDEDEKRMILAFSEQVRDKKPKSSDLIKNKGRGVLMLLCGPPGVGKTLTAESIAERAHVPLYAINAGEIGSTAAAADNTLNSVFECCRLWNAVLLLDEADVFLEARGVEGLLRNELVSVFLRRLEHFHGLMFLTTNHPRSLDSAFESRLDLIIPYADLDARARRIVWKTFVTSDGVSASTFTEADFDGLALHKCNGREIKNVVKIARMLATQDKTNLSMQHLLTVIKLRVKAAKALGNEQSS